jgi:DNA end-binding protein Ku
VPRPVWHGHIAFGLVNIGVVLYAAEHRQELQFRMLDSRNHARIRYERINEETGAEVPWDRVVRAFEYDDGNYVVMRDEDFARASPESSKAVDIERFVPQDAICAKWFDRPYLLAPDRATKGAKGYALLRDALRKTGRVGIGTVVIRTRAHLAALIPDGDVLMLNLLRYAQELHDIDDLGLPSDTFETPKISPREREMAEQLVDSMTGPWHPGDWHDDYRAQLRAYIDERVAKGQTESAPEDDAPAPRRSADVVDMTALLKRSLERRPAKPAKPAKKTAAPAGRSGTRRASTRKKLPAAGRKTARSRAA